MNQLSLADLLCPKRRVPQLATNATPIPVQEKKRKDAPETLPNGGTRKKPRKAATTAMTTAMTKRHKCTFGECTYATRSPSKLIVHTRRHTGEKPFECTWEGCISKFAHNSALKIHTRTHTGEKPYKCAQEDCDANFSDRSTLKRHMRIHTGERPYKCGWKECIAAFSHSGGLTSHMRTHTGEKPYQCEYEGCGATFTVNWTLKAHLRVHNGDKPYKCDWQECNAAFSRSGGLTTHLRIHTGEKPYQCEYEGCDHEFSQGHSLKIHQRAHTKWAWKSKGEEAINNLHNEWFGPPKNDRVPWTYQKTFNDCRNPLTNWLLRYDFGVESDVYGWLLIEFDGFYHNNPSPWDDGPEDLEKRQARDKIKTEYALENNYPLLRIETSSGLEKALSNFYEDCGVSIRSSQ